MPIDPREFGVLQEAVRRLELHLDREAKAREELTKQMGELQRLLAQVQGARWMVGVLVTVSGAVGAAVTWIIGLLRG